jgi:hypothetical protein
MNQRPGCTVFATEGPLGHTAEDATSPDGDVVEVPLLLAGWQVAALEAAARREGRTLAEMARRLIRDFLTQRRLKK